MLLNFLTARELAVDAANFDLTDIAEKLQKNGFSESVRVLVTPALPVARMVQDYLSRHPDPDSTPPAPPRRLSRSISGSRHQDRQILMRCSGRSCSMSPATI